MAFNINDFRSALQFGGARANLFQIEMDILFGNSEISRKLTFTAKAANLPPSNLDMITVPYFGRQIKVAGDRTFTEWQVTIINDEDFLVRDALERWNQAINSHVPNLNESGGPVGYKQRDASVLQYSKTGQNIRKYDFKNIWPATIDEIPVAWDTNNSIQEFGVTFQFDYWELGELVGAPAGGLNRTPGA